MTASSQPERKEFKGLPAVQVFYDKRHVTTSGQTASIKHALNHNLKKREIAAKCLKKKKSKLRFKNIC